MLSLGGERAGPLCTEEERSILCRLEEVAGPAGRLIARISARRPDAFIVEELSGPGIDDPHLACDELVDLGLLTEGAPWAVRLAVAPRALLSEYCRLRRLPRRGRKEELVARLLPVEPVPAERRMVGWPHRRLLDRVERFATLRREPDRGLLVAERLGHLAWPDYAPTRGAAFFADRDALLAWEALWQHLREGSLSVEQALEALELGTGDAPGGLSLRRRLRRLVREQAEALTRGGSPQQAAELLDRLEASAGLSADKLAVTRARCMELAGSPQQAMAHLAACREEARPDRRLAISRTGRRIARSIGGSWAPDPPLREPAERRLSMARVEAEGVRPRWRVGGEDRLIEGAIIARLAERGRVALRCEGGLARTLFALLFVDALLAPVAGALPVPRLSGPLDLGRSTFSCRRPRWIYPVLDAISAGEAPGRIQAACERFAGVRLVGVSMPLDPAAPLVAAAEALGPGGLRALLLPLLRDGLGAAAGLPDLLLLPGSEVTLPHAFPRRLGPDLCLVEVKGPGDSLRDGQRVWIDRLQGAGLRTEVWRVREDR